MQVFTTFELKTNDCVGYETLTKKLYKDTYAEEIELNETFNVFVTNFKLAYQGPNMAQAQIGSKYDAVKVMSGSLQDLASSNTSQDL